MKKRKIVIIIGLALLVVALSATWRWRYYTPFGRLVHGAEFEGIIFDPGKYSAERPHTNDWDVTPDHINEMESGLTKYVRDNQDKFPKRIVSDLPSYRRRYIGVTDGNKKLILVFFFHRRITSRHHWLRGRFDVMSGRDACWRITYNVSLRSFDGFLANAGMVAVANQRMNADRGIPRGFAALHTPAGYARR